MMMFLRVCTYDPDTIEGGFERADVIQSVNPRNVTMIERRNGLTWIRLSDGSRCFTTDDVVTVTEQVEAAMHETYEEAAVFRVTYADGGAEDIDYVEAPEDPKEAAVKLHELLQKVEG